VMQLCLRIFNAPRYDLFTQGAEFQAVRDAFRLLPEGSHLACRKRFADTVLPRVTAEIERKVADTLGGAPRDGVGNGPASSAV
jgi:hypothetical protein